MMLNLINKVGERQINTKKKKWIREAMMK